jgi:AraC family transcriptional regulator of adaptative response / DNA-3-methyladenine glycosylase II
MPLRRTGGPAFDICLTIGGAGSFMLRSARPREARTISLSLSYRPPFPGASLLGFLGDRAIPGVEEVGGATYRRSLSTPSGDTSVSVTHVGAADELRVDLALDDPRAVPFVERAVRSLFDLDAHPTPIARVLGRDAILRPLVRANPGIRLPGAADGFELVVRAIIGQQVSVPAARTMLGRVAARFGRPLADGQAPVTTVFPNADRLADARLEEFGIVGRRASAIRRVAAMVAGGELDLNGADPDATIRALLGVDGIGPWTAAYVRMRALHDPDAFPAGDLGVRRAVERLGLDPAPRAIEERAEAWRPWRAYAAMLLWRSEPATENDHG